MKNDLPLKPFYFIRHGESEWNVLGQFAGGQVDTPLTERGIDQANNAKAIFDLLSPCPSHIIHSPLSRAADTAQILNTTRQHPMIVIPDLREIDAGEWQGIPNFTAIEQWDRGLTPNNGENLDMFARRIQQALTSILNNQAYHYPFIAAHGRILNAIDCIYGIKPRELQAKNCEILKFTPISNQNRRSPWDVARIGIKNGQINEDMASWSQI